MIENLFVNGLPHENFEDETEKLKERVATLESENTRLKKEVKFANELVSSATHQIRGPLTSIRGYVACVLEGDFGKLPDDLKVPFNIIKKSSDTLGATVSDFLDVAKIEQGEMRYYLKDFDLADVVKEVCEEMKLGIEQDGLELRLSVPEGTFPVHSDKTKLKHVLINLIDNAHKYTKSGWIEVGLEKKQDGKITFSVKDSGMGIKKEIIPDLFKKFGRTEDARKLDSRGTGLGLYIARKIVEARHGRIWAESEGKGEGTQFYVELDSI